VAAIRESATIDSDHEASRVLLAAARSRSLTGPARDAYIRAAERLGEHEKNEVLAALVRTSR
jgi:hypothetical protein